MRVEGARERERERARERERDREREIDRERERERERGNLAFGLLVRGLCQQLGRVRSRLQLLRDEAASLGALRARVRLIQALLECSELLLRCMSSKQNFFMCYNHLSSSMVAVQAILECSELLGERVCVREREREGKRVREGERG